MRTDARPHVRIARFRSCRATRRAGNNVYSFLAAQQSTSGTIDIKAVLDWITQQGWMTPETVIGDVQMGYEITSSAGGLDFRTNDFGVTTN